MESSGSLLNRKVLSYISYQSSKTSTSKYGHLTNFSISKKKSCTDNLNQQEFGEGAKYCMNENKWSLDILQEYLQRENIDYLAIMTNIDDIVIKTIMSVHPKNSSNFLNETNCYELFGFDVLIDDKLKPWLMEVNISPSMKSSCVQDLTVKREVIADLFNTVGFKIDDLKLLSGDKTCRIPAKPDCKTRQRQKNALMNNGDSFSPSKEDLNSLCDFEDENSRKGNFIRLWPSKRFRDHNRFFSPQYADKLLYAWVLRDERDSVRIEELLKIEHMLKMKKVNISTGSNSSSIATLNYQ